MSCNKKIFFGNYIFLIYKIETLRKKIFGNMSKGLNKLKIYFSQKSYFLPITHG